MTASGYGYDPNTGQLNDLKLYPSGSTSNATGMQETTWKFDDATGALITKTYANGSFDTNTYNGVRLTGFAQGGTIGHNPAYNTTFGYNTAGEQTSSAAFDTATKQKVTNTVNSQDDQGRPTIVTGQTTDSLGRPTSAQTDVFTYSGANLTGESQVAGVTVAYDYYGVSDHSAGASPGALKAVRLVQGGSTLCTTTYQYDANTGRLSTIIVNGTSYSVGYRSGTNLLSSVSGGAVALAYNYEGGTGRLSSVYASHSDQVLYSAGYSYTQNDQRHTESVSQLNTDMTTTSSHNWTYGYNTQDQLTDVTDTSTSQSYYHYAFDGVGNDNAFGSVNSLNEYTTFHYNTRGDLTDDGTYTYTWDAADHLTAVTAKNNSVRVTFAYDGQDRRIEKDIYSWNASTSSWSLASTVKFIYDGRTIVAQTDGSNNLLATYAWGPEGLMGVTDYRSGTPHLYSVILDGGGNVVALADTASGQIVATYSYDPWGNQSSQGSAAGLCPFGYQQKYLDAEFGGYDSDLRELLSRLHRFANNDPIGIAGGSNTFLYGNDDPVNNADPNGTEPGAISRAWTRLKYVYTHPMTAAGTEINVGISLLKANPHELDRDINSYREAEARNFSASRENEYVLGYLSLQQGQANAVNGLQDVAVSILNTPASIDNAIYRLAGSNKRDVLIVSADWSRGMYIREGTDAHELSKFLGGNGAFIVITAGGGSLVSATSNTGRAIGAVNQTLTIANGTAGGLNAVSDFREGNVKGGSLNTGTAALNFTMAMVGGRGRIKPADDYIATLPSKLTPANSAADLYEIAQTGPVNYLASGGGAEYWMDGYKGTAMLDAKYVGNLPRSPFISGTAIPSDIRTIILKQQLDEFRRAAAIINDSSNPMKSLTVITNNQDAAETLRALMQQAGTPGKVTIRK